MVPLFRAVVIYKSIIWHTFRVDRRSPKEHSPGPRLVPKINAVLVFISKTNARIFKTAISAFRALNMCV